MKSLAHTLRKLGHKVCRKRALFSVLYNLDCSDVFLFPSFGEISIMQSDTIRCAEQCKIITETVHFVYVYLRFFFLYSNDYHIIII